MRKSLLWILVGLGVLTAVLLVRFTRQTDSFGRLMSLGSGYLEKGDATNAIATYSKAVGLVPENIDARLNLANAYLLAGDLEKVIEQSQQALKLDPNSAAAYYLRGCAYLRSNQAEHAVQAFQQSQKIDPAVTALNFQLGLAHERAGQLEDAIQQFETVIQFEPEHPSGHYQLSRLYQRAGRDSEAAQELAKHEEVRAKNPIVSNDPAFFERCKYTQPRLVVAPDQPEQKGAIVQFVNATSFAFGDRSPLYRGPVGVIDYNHDGRNSLFVMEADSFRLLSNSNGQFKAKNQALPGPGGTKYNRCLVGDLNNDRFEDVIMLGDQSSHMFRFATNGQFREVTQAAGLKELKGQNGLLADLDFTGKLDLLAVDPTGNGLRVWRNLGNAYFRESTTNSGLPLHLTNIVQIAVEDWNNEDVPGVLVGLKNRPPLFYAKRRAGTFAQTNLTESWPAGNVLSVGDLNNDLLLDFAVADEDSIHVGFGHIKGETKLSLNGMAAEGLLLLDYDNDGWLDLLAYGKGIRLWRNAGKRGFQDRSATVGLDKVGSIESVHAADFDNDGDTDLVTATSTGLEFWRNDGANANKQMKLQLVGNRSNASALGSRVEVTAGNWRAIRTLHHLPLEIGIGKHSKIDVLKVRWFDLATTLVDLPVQPAPLTVGELTLPSGSCPYLYAWNGERFNFVTDILGASPLGLPVSEKHFVEADPEELLSLGSDEQFPAKDGKFEVRITEELREVLYLDEARLVVVDHPTGTFVHPTSKMLPGPPFLPHQLWNLRPVLFVKDAIRSDGLNVTEALSKNDRVVVSPVRLREPQLRGLAEPFSMTLDFGELPVNQQLVLVMNGWLRFGGGMANIAASLDPSLPFPFPTLEAEMPDGAWKRIDTLVGVPAGKTKTILVDLENKLPPGSRRLRWTCSFEIHWDSVSLCQKIGSSLGEADNRNHCKVYPLQPEVATLRWRGFSEFASLPDWLPLTPEYDKVRSMPPWRRTPTGWCTRYGRVNELLEKADGALVILNGGDELGLSFRAEHLPAKPSGFSRTFFLKVLGWDKDADFHVAQGWRVEPLPFVGMDSQTYGFKSEALGVTNDWARKYNTRWVDSLMLSRSLP